MKEEFISEIKAAYQFKGDSIVLGCGMLNGAVLPEAPISIPLRMVNRHGLIAGATGTGKTKSLQLMAEQLSSKGVPSVLLDIKGDLSGIALEGSMNSKISERHTTLNIPWEPHDNFVELLSISNEPGVRLRATVTEFG
ncbi:MAG: helicase HerA-like domain-containing protein, partial [Saprospiraceae bacterium]